jgi:diketogulonate reductase-like aldo/keto reductase
MDRILSLKNGIEMPRIGLGTFRSSPEEIKLAVTTALQMGIMHVDTASIYKNQEAIGEAIKAAQVPRSKVPCYLFHDIVHLMTHT